MGKKVRIAKVARMAKMARVVEKAKARVDEFTN